MLHGIVTCNSLRIAALIELCVEYLVRCDNENLLHLTHYLGLRNLMDTNENMRRKFIDSRY